jgi:acyl carrier protein
VDLTNQVINLVGSVLSLGERTAKLTANSALLGAIPELDSMAVVSLLTSIEEKFGVVIADDEVDGRTFASVGSLVTFVDGKLRG